MNPHQKIWLVERPEVSLQINFQTAASADQDAVRWMQKITGEPMLARKAVPGEVVQTQEYVTEGMVAVLHPFDPEALPLYVMSEDEFLHTSVPGTPETVLTDAPTAWHVEAKPVQVYFLPPELASIEGGVAVDVPPAWNAGKPEGQERGPWRLGEPQIEFVQGVDSASDYEDSILGVPLVMTRHGFVYDEHAWENGLYQLCEPPEPGQ